MCIALAHERLLSLPVSLCVGLFSTSSLPLSYLFRRFRFTHVFLSTANAYSSISSSCESLYRSLFYLFPISFTGIFSHMYRCQPPMPTVVLPLPPRRPHLRGAQICVYVCVLGYVCLCVLSYVSLEGSV